MIENKYKAQAAYAERNGLVSKAYKLKKTVVEDFKEACSKSGESQASVLQNLMVEYIEKYKNPTA